MNNSLPRPGSTLYGFHFKGTDQKKKKLRSWQKLNKCIVIPLYRSGLFSLFGFGRYILLLTTTNEQGRKRRTPLEYRSWNDKTLIYSAMGEKSAWVKNLHTRPETVRVRRGFSTYRPFIRFINSEKTKIEILKWYVQNFGMSAKIFFGWDPKKDDVESVDFSRLANLLSIFILERK
ncbi:MAG: nitroreductase/quinone reductase family protein [Promethearchaeota archaeon]